VGFFFWQIYQCVYFKVFHIFSQTATFSFWFIVHLQMVSVDVYTVFSGAVGCFILYLRTGWPVGRKKCVGETTALESTTTPQRSPHPTTDLSSPPSLHPVAPVSVDLHHTVLGQRFPGVARVKPLAAHLVPAQRVQAHGRHEAAVKLDLLAEVGGPLLTGVPRALLGRGQEDHQLKVGGVPLAEGRVQWAAAVQRVVEGEGEDEEGAGPGAQVVQLEVQRGLVQRLALVLLIEQGADLHVHQGAHEHVGGAQHEACLALVLTYHRLRAELNGSGSLLGPGDLGHKRTWMLDTMEVNQRTVIILWAGWLNVIMWYILSYTVSYCWIAIVCIAYRVMYLSSGLRLQCEAFYSY